MTISNYLEWDPINAPDLEKTGILGSWILRNIFQNHQIEEHLEQYLAYFDFVTELSLKIEKQSSSIVPYLPFKPHIYS